MLDATTLEQRLIRHFAYQSPETELTLSNLKRSMRRSLELDHPAFRDHLIVEAMQLLEILGIAERVSDRAMKWRKKVANNA